MKSVWIATREEKDHASNGVFVEVLAVFSNVKQAVRHIELIAPTHFGWEVEEVSFGAPFEAVTYKIREFEVQENTNDPS